MKHGRTTWHWWCPRKSRIQEKQRSIRHVLKKADKTWVVHLIHEFLDDEYQINKIWTDLCSHTVYEILEHFLNPGHGEQCESRSSLAESAILKYHWSRIGHDCRPCRLKFNMENVSKDRNVFPVYKLISHDIFILMFCNSLEQCKISLHSSCCTRVNRNHLFFQFFPQNFWSQLICLLL